MAEFTDINLHHGLTGEEIRSFRRDRQMSQQRLAVALDVSLRAIQEWESGRSRPPYYLRVALQRMAIGKPEVPSWMYSERDTDRALIASLESGKLRTGVDHGRGWIDATAESLARAKERLANNEYMILRFEEASRV